MGLGWYMKHKLQNGLGMGLDIKTQKDFGRPSRSKYYKFDKLLVKEHMTYLQTI